MKKLFGLLSLVLCLGCGGNKQEVRNPWPTFSPPKAKPATISCVDVLAQYSSDHFCVETGRWDIALPNKYKLAQHFCPETASCQSYTANDRASALTFIREPTDATLQNYTSDIANAFTNSGAQITAARKGHMADTDAALLIIHLTNPEAIVLDFITVKNNEAFSFACITPVSLADIADFKQCFEIARSVKYSQ